MPIGKPGTGYWSNTGWVEGGSSANDPTYSALTQSGQTFGVGGNEASSLRPVGYGPSSPDYGKYGEFGAAGRGEWDVSGQDLQRAISSGVPMSELGEFLSDRTYLSPAERERQAQQQLIAGTTPSPVLKMPQYNPAVYGTDGVDGLLSGETAYMTEEEKEEARARARRDQLFMQAQKEQGSLLSQIFSGKTQRQVQQEAERATGIISAEYFADQKKRIAELDTLNKQYANTVAQRDASMAKEQDRIAPLSVINGRSAQIARQYAPELNRMSANINSKAAVMEALKGNYAEAQKYVQQAVDAFTADKKAKVDQYVMLRESYQDIFNLLDEDYQRAYLASENASKRDYENAREDKQQVLSLMIDNPQAGILATDTLEQAAMKVSRTPTTSMTQPTIAGATTTPTTSPVSTFKFTSSQLNKGANNAGVSGNEFNGLNEEVKNYFVSSTASQMNAINEAFSQLKSGDISADDLIQEINSSNMAPSVKTYFLDKIKTETPQEEKGFFSKLSDIFSIGKLAWTAGSTLIDKAIK